MAEDEEGQTPDQRRPRGPRVVTGEMKRAARASRVVTGPSVTPPPGDDPPAEAETLVGPGAPAPPAPGTSRRSQGPAGGPASAPPPPPPAQQPEPEPEPWRPIEVTRTLPPAVHRSAPAPEPPPTKKRTPKPARQDTDGAGSGAGLAFVLAVASLVLVGLTAIPALVVAGRAKRRRGRGGGLVTAARVIAVVSLAAWLTVAGIVVADLARPEGVDYAELQAGDCIDTPEGTEVRRIRVRACDKPHDAEVFAVISHPAAPGDAFPGANALLEYAANACLGQPFTDYIGVPRGQSQLTEFEIVPEREAWEEGRRGLVCAVDNADRSPLTSSVKGSAR